MVEVVIMTMMFQATWQKIGKGGGGCVVDVVVVVVDDEGHWSPPGVMI